MHLLPDVINVDKSLNPIMLELEIKAIIQTALCVQDAENLSPDILKQMEISTAKMITNNTQLKQIKLLFAKPVDKLLKASTSKWTTILTILLASTVVNVAGTLLENSMRKMDRQYAKIA